MNDALQRLFTTIESRRSADPAVSYVAKMLGKGPAKIAKKVGEEGVEVAIAATQNAKESTVRESADLVFHLMLLWAAMGITPADVMAELERREGVSGIEEKKKRTW
jgi:phosphoribosyl-ATP pyrophosphohydrolase